LTVKKERKKESEQWHSQQKTVQQKKEGRILLSPVVDDG
jgi:hypothetical protein